MDNIVVKRQMLYENITTVEIDIQENKKSGKMSMKWRQIKGQMKTRSSAIADKPHDAGL